MKENYRDEWHEIQNYCGWIYSWVPLPWYCRWTSYNPLTCQNHSATIETHQKCPCMYEYVCKSVFLSVYYVCMYNQIHTCQPICIHILCPYPPSFKAIKIRIYRGALISIFAGAPKSAASFQRFRCFWNSVLLHLANRSGRHTDMDEWHPLKTPHYQNCNKCLTPSAGTSVKPLYTAHANQYQPNCCCHIQKNDNRVGHQCVVRQMVWVSDSTPPPRKQHTLVVIFYAPKHVMAWRNIKLTFKASAEDVREHQRA